MSNPIEKLAIKFASDKRAEIHGYTDHYWRYFQDVKPKRLLEIGVFGGASVNMWAEFFPGCHITGVDSNPNTLTISSINKRIELLIGDQADREFLGSLGEYELIIDDGGHSMRQQITSFEALWPKLTRGGLYIIEDLHTSYWPDFRDQGLTTIEFLKNLIDSVQFNGLSGYGDIFSQAAITDRKGYGLDHLRQNISQVSYADIEWIHMYKSIVFIKKRDA